MRSVPFVGLVVASLLLAGCSGGNSSSAPSPTAPPFAMSLKDASGDALCAEALSEAQRKPLNLVEVSPYSDDGGVESCYFLQSRGEGSEVNRGFVVTVYPSLEELRGSVSGDWGGTLPRPLVVGGFPGAEHVDLGELRWTAGITVAADQGRYIYVSSWAPNDALSESELTRQTSDFANVAIANLAKG